MKTLMFGIATVCAIIVFAAATVILGESPLIAYSNWSDLYEFLPYVNYFVPIDKIIAVAELWLFAENAFLIYQFVIKSISTCSDLKPL